MGVTRPLAPLHRFKSGVRESYALPVSYDSMGCEFWIERKSGILTAMCQTQK